MRALVVEAEDRENVINVVLSSSSNDDFLNIQFSQPNEPRASP